MMKKEIANTAPKSHKGEHITIYILFVLSATMIVLNRFTAMYINNSTVHFVFLFTATASFAIIVGHIFGKLKTIKSILITYLVVALLCLAKAFFTWGGDWKTVTVFYQNKSNASRTIEFQMRADRFSFWFKRRTVERLQILPFVDWIKDTDTIGLDKSQWEKIRKGETLIIP